MDPPVLCGHRGSGRGEGENTLGSFLAGVELGLRWVEMDARLNADGVLVSHHDAMAGGRFVSELRSAETDELGLARVAELLDALPPEIGVDLDVKTSLEDAARPHDETTAAMVARLVGESRARPLLVSSFDPSAILIFRELAPDVPIGLLTWLRYPLRKAIPAAVHLGAEVVAPHVASVLEDERPPAETVRAAHDAGLEVLVWNSRPEQRDVLIAAGVDCLVIDDVLASLAS